MNRPYEYHILGNSMRLNSTPVIRQDEHWRTELTQAELEAFDSMAGRMNDRRLG